MTDLLAKPCDACGRPIGGGYCYCQKCKIYFCLYRTLRELEKKGLVERVVSKPCKFRAVPLRYGMQILLTQQAQRFKEIREKTEEFLRKHQTQNKEATKQEYKLIMVEGRHRLIQIMRYQHDSVQRNVNVLTVLPRWLQILDFCFEDYKKAIDRGVQYKVVLEACKGENMLHENIQALLKKQDFELRLSPNPLKTNAAIFDENEVTINLHPSQSLAESPIVWTNHPSFISMCKDHFDKIWKSAKEYQLKN
jgi:sugar-specific transcriptional regulator TrmB